VAPLAAAGAMTTRRIAGVAPAIAAYWAAVGALLYLSLGRSQGRLVYPLDDSYVHMAMAKNMALHGVWGVTSEQFTSASSSPLWTALLAFTYTMTGVSDWPPLAWNLLIGTAAVVSVHRLLVEARYSPLAAMVATVGVTFAGTLATMTLLGMEHTLHLLLTLWFVTLGARMAGGDARQGDWWPLAALAAVLTVTRYEGLFAVACVAGVLTMTGRWRTGLVIAAAGAMPVVIYGLWSQSQGSFMLPNSVLLKGVTPALTVVGVIKLVIFWPALTALSVNPHLAVLLIAALGLAVMARRDAGPSDRAWFTLIFAGCTLLHLQFARAGWFYRYEAYLVVLGLMAVATSATGVEWRDWRRQPALASMAAAMVLVVVMAFPLVRRGANALRQTPAAVSNIFEQQFQAGLFLDEFYRGRRVAVNDVGAIGYLADVRLLDVWGLASVDTAALKRQGAFTSDALADLAGRGAAEIAIIYPSWLGEYGGVPPAWQKVGEWRVSDNVVLGESAMSFYAVSGPARDELVQNLSTFAGRLPATVVQEGVYRAGH
jgi:hypothetical protein